MFEELEELLNGNETPEQIVSFRLSPGIEDRVADLMRREKEFGLGRDETVASTADFLKSQ